MYVMTNKLLHSLLLNTSNLRSHLCHSSHSNPGSKPCHLETSWTRSHHLLVRMARRHHGCSLLLHSHHLLLSLLLLLLHLLLLHHLHLIGRLRSLLLHHATLLLLLHLTSYHLHSVARSHICWSRHGLPSWSHPAGEHVLDGNLSVGGLTHDHLLLATLGHHHISSGALHVLLYTCSTLHLLPLHLKPLEVLDLLWSPWHLSQCRVRISRPSLSESRILSR